MRAILAIGKEHSLALIPAQQFQKEVPSRPRGLQKQHDKDNQWDASQRTITGGADIYLAVSDEGKALLFVAFP